MHWWGKVLGGAFGFALGGPLGALLGAVVGHQFDKGLGRALSTADHEEIQAAFFTATFAVMGRVAKADGQVSEQEIGFAEAVMAHMALDAEQRKAAIGLFRQGKRDDFDLDGVLDQFQRVCQRRATLMRMFLEIQLQAGYADGKLHKGERDLLLYLFQRLGFSRAEFVHLESMVRAARDFTGRGPGVGGAGRPARKNLVAEAYEVLGVPATASAAEIKRAYRRLMNQHHPDKLVAKGLPEEMMKLATEKTQEIKNAYELIKESRGLR